MRSVLIRSVVQTFPGVDMSDLSNPSLGNLGERLVTDWCDESVAEHLHRYAVATSLCAGKTVLDIACGEGYGSNLLAKVANSVFGVDVSVAAVEHARQKYRRNNLRYLVGSAIAIPLLASSVDTVVSFETLEHLVQHEEMLDELKRVLKPDGLLIISTPDRRHSSDLPGYSNPFHVRELYTQEFRQLVAKRFAHLRMYFQCVSTASLLVPESNPIGFEHYSGNFEAIANVSGLPRPLYNLCIAGDIEPPQLPLSVFNADFVVEEKLRTLTNQTRRLEARLKNLEGSLSLRIGQIVTGPLRWARDLIS